MLKQTVFPLLFLLDHRTDLNVLIVIKPFKGNFVIYDTVITDTYVCKKDI